MVKAKHKHRPLHHVIAWTAAALNEQRERWVNPPEWVEPLRETVMKFEDFSGVPEDARPALIDSALAAYAATDRKAGPGDWDGAWAAAWRDTGAGQPPPTDAAPEALTARQAADDGVLAPLLRLNLARAAKP